MTRIVNFFFSDPPNIILVDMSNLEGGGKEEEHVCICGSSSTLRLTLSLPQSGEPGYSLFRHHEFDCQSKKEVNVIVTAVVRIINGNVINISPSRVFLDFFCLLFWWLGIDKWQVFPTTRNVVGKRTLQHRRDWSSERKSPLCIWVQIMVTEKQRRRKRGRSSCTGNRLWSKEEEKSVVLSRPPSNYRARVVN